MSDLIDRQAAIEAIEQMQMPIMRSEFPEEQFVFTGMSEALQAIKDLPSAPPEKLCVAEVKSKSTTSKTISTRPSRRSRRANGYTIYFKTQSTMAL